MGIKIHEHWSPFFIQNTETEFKFLIFLNQNFIKYLQTRACTWQVDQNRFTNSMNYYFIFAFQK